jgi:ribosomal protein L32
MFWNSLQLVSNVLRQRLFGAQFLNPRFQPQLVGVSQQLLQEPDSGPECWQQDSIWFAVPKRKHTRSRKRKKTTTQKRIPLKHNIVFDPRTGEVTLRHKLPFNWKDYLPKLD